MTILHDLPVRADRGPTDRVSPLALGAVLGPVAFTLTWLLLGFTSTGYTLFGHEFTDYSPISQPISGLGLGDTAAYMNTAFVVTGLALVIGVFGIFRAVAGQNGPAGRDRAALRRAAMVLLACTGVGQILCGLFTLDEFMPHTLGYFLAIGAPVVGFLVAGRWFRAVPSWRRFGTGLLLGSPLTLALLVAFFMTFQPTADGAEHGVAGLVQRLGVLEVHAWFIAMGWRAWQLRRNARL